MFDFRVWACWVWTVELGITIITGEEGVWFGVIWV